MPETHVSRSRTDRENDIVVLRDKVSELRAAEGVKRAAADAFVDECKRAGLDPITGTGDADKDAFNRIDNAFKAADELASQAKEFEGRLERLVVTTGHEADAKSGGDINHPAMKRALSMAEKFLASEDYRALQRSGALDLQGARVQTSAVHVASREQLMAAMFPSQAHLAALDVDALVPTDRTGLLVGIPQRDLKVRDLVSVGTTDTDTVEWVEEITANHAAAERAYGLSAPESTYEYELREAAVKRIAHFVKATKGNLADAGQLRTLLDNRLVYGAAKRVDTQMINGTGTADILGILNTPNLQDVDATGDNIADAMHKGLTAVRLSLEDEPDAFLLHPEAYEQFVLAKGNDGHYLNLQGPQTQAPANVWGKSAVVSTVINADSALVGNWKMGATLWLRSGISIAVTDSDQADFIKGIITILAELRAAFAVTQVNAFAEIANLGDVS